MNKKRILAIAVVLAAAALPALADFTVLKDSFDPKSGIGVVMVRVDKMRVAQIMYKDMDGSASYTTGDTRLRIRYFRDRQPVQFSQVR